MKQLKKVLLWIVSIVAALAVVLGIAVFALWHNEIATVASFQQVRTRNDDHLDGSVYTMEVKGGFYLDDFIAQGGAKSDAELIDFITGKITKGLLEMEISESEIACSAFTAQTQDGDRLFGRNYDFSKTNACIVFTEATEGRHATISTVDLQFLGMDVDQDVEGLMNKVTCLAAPYAPLDGVNDAGVSCGIFMSYQGEETIVPTDLNTDKPDITSTTLLRLILDYADNVEEAVEIASTYDLHDSAATSYHYMVADATGASVILEWVNGTDATDLDGSARQLVVTYNDDDAHIGEAEGQSDYQWITNFIIQPGYYDDPADQKGLDRYQKLYEQLSQTDGIVADEEAAMEILASVGRRNWSNDDKNTCTVHSAVYNLTDKSVLWVSNENYQDETAIFRFSLEK
ncbi:MAG TPA: linear amide C-N hydrolase [Candidatus Faecousia faecavium]|nr:linear amide C-N hydrolase [Candidatus Faecousia faecavium]